MIVTVFRKDTGEKVRVPEHWLEHPTLGAPFSRTRRAGAASTANDKKEKKDA